MKLYLIGFMGSGKSLVGKMLAERLGYRFVDTDAIIEDKFGRSIRKIFEEEGEVAFRSYEAETLRNITSRKTVISTGGGLPCYNNNLQWMNDNGVTLYLETHPEVLMERLIKEVDHRPLLAGKNKHELLKFIESKLDDRRLFYENAQFSCRGDSPAQELVNVLVSYFKRF